MRDGGGWEKDLLRYQRLEVKKKRKRKEGRKEGRNRWSDICGFKNNTPSLVSYSFIKEKLSWFSALSI